MAKRVSKTTSKKKKKPAYSKETYFKWYETALRVRRFEERALVEYGKQNIRGFCHVYIGQEAIAAALTTAITPEDSLVTAYRQHGVALARGLTSRECMAELFGKYTGCVKGKGGSMHFFSKKLNYFGGNGIVGAQIPIGTGIAFAEKYRGTKNLCVCMFGDGAARQGALYESFNMAMNWNVPVLYIVENNGYAMGTSVSRTSNVHDIHQVGEAFGMPHRDVDGMDTVAVHEAIKEAADHIRAGKGPYFLEIKTYRYKGHSVSDPAKYRTRDELNSYRDRDPIKQLEKAILDLKIGSEAEIKAVKTKIKEEVEDSVKFAIESPLPPVEELWTDNYTQEDYPFIKEY